MKILHVNTIDTGGAAIAAIRLHYLLLDNGHDSKILFLKRKNDQTIREAYYFEDLFQSRWLFKFIDLLNTAYNRRFTFFHPGIFFNGPDSLYNLTRHELFQWADIIHLHWVIKFLDWRKVFTNPSKKFVWTLHDMNPMTGGEHYQTDYHQEFNGISKWNIRKKKAAIKNTQLSIIAPSKWLTELSKKSEVFKDITIRTIKNPVDIAIFKCKDTMSLRTKYNLPPDKIILLFVAENPADRRKGYKLLLEAISKLTDKEKYHLAVIGKQAVIPESISYTMMGIVKDEAVMSDLYNTADCFVIPSIEDNLPNTVSEALLCGTPITGFNIGGIPDMVKNGTNGYLSEQFEDLTKAIVNTCEQAFDKANIRNEALETLAPESLFSNFLTVYH